MLDPHWSRRSVVYQIYPLSFKDSNADGRGDLAGIIEKLDYLKNTLGVDALWLCPFFKSPMADFGYDVEDYTAIDPVFGDMPTFERLVSEMHKRDMKLIVDFVGNHTSVRHPWFEESRSSRDNPKRNWYVWADPKPGEQGHGDPRGNPQGNPPNNWLSIFGGPSWEFDKKTGQYYLHTFLKEQPDLNWQNPEVQKAMMNVIDFWVEKGVDGFRVDALQNFLENDKLADDIPNPDYKKETDEPYKALVHQMSLEGKGAMKILGRFLSEALDKHPNIFIVGEVYLGPSDLFKVYKLCPNDRFMPFNFNLVGAPWKASEYKKIIDAYQTGLKTGQLANYTIGNHDIARIATRLGEAQSALAAFLQFTLPGMPFIYYGDEIGMKNGVIPPNIARDFLAKVFPGFVSSRDLERTPMQWDDSPHAGFTEGKPWLPVSSDYKTRNVERQKNEKDSTLSLYTSLTKMRRTTPALGFGNYIPRRSHSADVFSFERQHGGERFIVLANFSENVQREILPVTHREPSIIFSTSTRTKVHHTSKVIELMPYEGYVIKI